MPKNKRWFLRSKLRSSVKCIESSEKYIIEVAMEYKDVHPDIYNEFCCLIPMYDLIIKTIKMMEARL